MSDWPSLFLAVIAAATVVMAVTQLCLVVYGARLARRVDRLADRIEREIEPVIGEVHQVIGKIHEMSGDGARATELAVAQVERADELMSRLARRAEETIDVAQQLLVTPVRQGLALIDGWRAIWSSLRSRATPRSGDTKSTEEDEALFIG